MSLARILRIGPPLCRAREEGGEALTFIKLLRGTSSAWYRGCHPNVLQMLLDIESNFMHHHDRNIDKDYLLQIGR